VWVTTNCCVMSGMLISEIWAVWTHPNMHRGSYSCNRSCVWELRVLVEGGLSVSYIREFSVTRSRNLMFSSEVINEHLLRMWRPLAYVAVVSRDKRVDILSDFKVTLFHSSGRDVVLQTWGLIISASQQPFKTYYKESMYSVFEEKK
jgi:hypothetical protein